jgi:N-formylglutamate amidohydrolase
VAVGLGTIARVVADGQAIYRRKLGFAEARRRIDGLYRPYHAALEALVADTVARFGRCLVIDAHSMPSADAEGGRRPDIVLGDRLGSSCAAVVTETARRTLGRRRHTVALNAPYAGGFTTIHYGRPEVGRHCLQIEINRALYMDEASFERKPHFETLKAEMGELIAALGAIEPGRLDVPGLDKGPSQRR